ncbi:MAG: EAL domain-containing protein [Desulfuromonadaceae bacterium]|nr:EAL domain-containing protein [Desulfuromonadaceae bacterium]MDD2855168.1 EAL domain-containing protein [Desulfuromonadaceae bacterium]
MKPEQKDNSSWIQTLSGIIYKADNNINSEERLDESCVRIQIVSKTRWVMLGVVSVYALIAAVSFSFSRIGFQFTKQQVLFLSLTIVSVFIYNFLISRNCPCLSGFSHLIHLQIFLDLFFVTTLIHFTGGVFSWFWPVYILVTLEAAFLFDDKRDVWLIGTLGAALYGALLVSESVHLIPIVTMPFVDSSQHKVFLFQMLMWCWVAGMNATVAFIAAFLMETIRNDRARVKASEGALLGFITSANDLIFSVDNEGRILYANQTFRELLIEDKTAEDSYGNLYELVNSEFRQRLSELISKVLSSGVPGQIEVSFGRPEKFSVDVEMSLTSGVQGGNSRAVWGVCRDITERKRAQTALYSLAHHDNLTGLPNRILLEDRIVQAKALAHRQKTGFALLFLDLDRFKIINDTLGHSVGDELLRMVASRLQRTLRETDTVARIGGDEFIILLVNTKSKDDVLLLAEKIMKSLTVPFNLREHELFVTTSLGACMYPEDEEDTESIMKKADIAMYHAKALGRNNFQFYNNQMDQNASRRFVISNSIRNGLERKEFRLYYQPKVDVTSGRIVAMEALLRWDHPELGLLSPLEFIQLAEENGLIVELGEWVLREACRQNVQWHNEGILDLRVAVNLSGYQLQHHSLIPSIKRVLGDTGISANNLEFEITESVVMQNPDYAIKILSEITEMGIHISIDDFGTGYSSLAHLKRFSVNTLKIDKSFVKDVSLNSTDAAIASAIIAMGNSLNLNVIAEGVETQEQYDFLKENNCGQVQGFLFSRPLPSDEFVKVFKQNFIDIENMKKNGGKL